MRMWNVDAFIICDRHLLGEHCECHSFLGTIKKGTSIKGYIEKGLLEVHNLKKRHDELAAEMIKRGMNHKSEFPEFKLWNEGYINSNQNIIELKNRCEKCRKNIEYNFL
jgi:hypothetical protein